MAHLNERSRGEQQSRDLRLRDMKAGSIEDSQ